MCRFIFSSSWVFLLLSVFNVSLCAPRPERAQAIKDAFRFAWEGYYEYAFPADEIRPQSQTAGNSRNGWGCSAVDALSTAIILDDAEAVNQILDYIPTIDFSKSNGGGGDDEEVSLFETTIRYLAGMLSGYDLLKGPAAHLAQQAGDAKVEALLEQSKHLANNLSFAFDTPSGIPANIVYFNNRTHQEAGFVTIAAAGTLVLEWTRLADLSGNRTYAELTEKAESYLLKPWPAENEPWPGLIGANVYLKDGALASGSGGWFSGSDSFYEYLIKMYIYDPVKYENYKDRWVLAADSSVEHLVSHPSTRPDLTFLAQFQFEEQKKNIDELSCFDGGNFILGGTTLGRQDLVDFGIKLVEGCHATYTATATGIGPFSFGWDDKDVPPEQQAFFEKNGFYIKSTIYGLNPEMIESYYYAYQATGNETYQDWAWDVWLAINKTCRTTSGFAAIWNVNEEDGGALLDGTSSFFFAEVLKYSYMIQAEPGPWSPKGEGFDSWVYNTEAHPFRVMNANVQSDSGTSSSSNEEQDNSATDTDSADGDADGNTASNAQDGDKDADVPPDANGGDTDMAQDTSASPFVGGGGDLFSLGNQDSPFLSAQYPPSEGYGSVIALGLGVVGCTALLYYGLRRYRLTPDSSIRLD